MGCSGQALNADTGSSLWRVSVSSILSSWWQTERQQSLSRHCPLGRVGPLLTRDGLLSWLPGPNLPTLIIHTKNN